jgi:hypothetical protein
MYGEESAFVILEHGNCKYDPSTGGIICAFFCKNSYFCDSNGWKKRPFLTINLIITPKIIYYEKAYLN